MARTKNWPGFLPPPLTRCLYETRLYTFIPERSRACLGLFASARHGDRPGQRAAKLRQQHAIEPGSWHIAHAIGSECGTTVIFRFRAVDLGLDVYAV